MKMTPRSTFAVLLAVSLTIGASARSATNQPPGPNGPGEHHDGGGGPGPGDHHHFRGFMLQPTASAPDGAGGWAVISADTTPPALRVATRGLAVGTYTVKVTAKSDGSVTSFGTFDVHLPVDPIPVGEHGDDNEPLRTEASLDFPAAFDPANVASIQIADASAVTLLAGEDKPHDGTPRGRDHEHEQFRLQPTADAPADARGHAEIAVENHNGAPVTAALKIETRSLAAGTYTVSVTSLASGSATVLGTFDVTAPAGENEDSENESSLVFPVGLDPADVASVKIADANGITLLSGEGGVRGGHVEGSEHLHERVILQAATDAPVGAGGVAKIEAHNRQGASKAALEIKTNGLAAGTYTVSVTSLADGSVTVLGTFDIAGTDMNDDGDVSFDSEREAGLAFPDGFNPLDVAGIQVADATGVVMLTGDFSNVAAAANANFMAKVRITPGAAGPEARGIATATTRVRRHVVRQSFTLAAKGAPADSTLTVQVNGVSVGTVKSSDKGRVVVPKLPRSVHVHKITSVTLEDEDGTTVLSAQF